MTRRELPPLSIIAALAAVALLWLCAGLAMAVELPESCRVRNIEGRCCWACIATLGYRHDIRALQSLAPDRKILPAPRATDDNVRRKLIPLGVVWRGFDHGSFDRSLLPMANTHGVIVGMEAGTPWLGNQSLTWPHCIILTRYDKDEVEFFCPDNPRHLWRKTRQWFDGGWRGNSMVFDPND
jgi:hypothetical protein